MKFAACAEICNGEVHGVTERAGGVIPAAQKGQAGKDETVAVPAAFAALSGTSATAPAPRRPPRWRRSSTAHAC